VWQQQPPSFFEEAILDADGTMVETTGQCKQGMNMSYKGEWVFGFCATLPSDRYRPYLRRQDDLGERKLEC
jgi:hypothetical protein